MQSSKFEQPKYPDRASRLPLRVFGVKGTPQARRSHDLDQQVAGELLWGTGAG